MTSVQPQSVQLLGAQDQARVLEYLENSSRTAAEIARAIPLSVNRVNGLLLDLEKHGKAHVDHCIRNVRGDSINVWTSPRG
ncbi:hypothetical protein B1757_10225 [Acidithiobacillus marinus]|uniref:DprA winged helix domain-containing protein n=1 Tax=Acidithiobacillus marinus TaxID=187490 RepID=A0A2I1DKC1_9PROT|nr:hypothetical protein B1757_10225 [Acidithiobacillus marinus]